MLGVQRLGLEELGMERCPMDHTDIQTRASGKGEGTELGRLAVLPPSAAVLRGLGEHVLFRLTGKVTELNRRHRANPELRLEFTLWCIGTGCPSIFVASLCWDLEVDRLNLQQFKLEDSEEETGFWGCIWEAAMRGQRL